MWLIFSSPFHFLSSLWDHEACIDLTEKQTACQFTLFTYVVLYKHSHVHHLLSGHTGGSFTGWLQERLLCGRLAQAETANWIAPGVILTCSLTVKFQMFWFILSPISICLHVFSAKGGFSTEGLVKAGPICSIHGGRKVRKGAVPLSHDSDTFMSTYSHIHTHYIHLPQYLLLYYVIKIALKN